MEQMTQEALEARREYQREWSRKNPDKVREKNRRYWEKLAAKRKEKEREQAAE